MRPRATSSRSASPQTDDPVLAAHRLLGRLAADRAPDRPAPRAWSSPIDPDTVDAESLADRGRCARLRVAVLPLHHRQRSPRCRRPTPPAPTARHARRTSALGSYPLRRPPSRSRRSTATGRWSAAAAELIAPYERHAGGERRRRPRPGPTPARRRLRRSAASRSRSPPSASRPRTSVTLGARDAQFPLADRVLARLPGARWSSSSSPTTASTSRATGSKRRSNPGAHVVTIQVKTRAPPATRPVRITVRSPDDGVILAESQYTIRSTAVSGVGILLTIGAALFLVRLVGPPLASHPHGPHARARRPRGRPRRPIHPSTASRPRV